jgi:hypothetical protein
MACRIAETTLLTKLSCVAGSVSATAAHDDDASPVRGARRDPARQLPAINTKITTPDTLQRISFCLLDSLSMLNLLNARIALDMKSPGFKKPGFSLATVFRLATWA